MGTGAKLVEDGYFNELLGAGVERLSREPELLRAEQDQLARQIEETSIAGYRAFIKASKCLEGLRSELQEVHESLEKLENGLPELQKAATGFRKESLELAKRRDALRSLYANHPALLELLEIASLMETCIRAGHYDEALDLKSFAVKLAVGHGELPVVQRLLQDIGAAAKVMLESLLQRLCGPVQLPECLRIIGYLRRLAVFSEHGLRQAFLQRREAWIASLLLEVDDSSAYDFLKKVTDVYRLHVFDVMMQYRAIFAGGDEDGILSFWAHRRVTAYAQVLKENLPRVSDGGGLSSILDTAMYCGASLGRVGLDFRPLIAQHFESAAAKLFNESVARSTESFAEMLNEHRWMILPSTAGRIAALRRQQEEHEGKEAGSSHADNANSGEVGERFGLSSRFLAPPPVLIEHAPLAVYLNGLLAAFNELRHCAPTAIMGSCADSLKSSLTAAAVALSEQSSARSFNGEEEKRAYKGACSAFTSTLCPFVAKCFDKIFIGKSVQYFDVSEVGKILEDATNRV